VIFENQKSVGFESWVRYCTIFAPYLRQIRFLLETINGHVVTEIFEAEDETSVRCGVAKLLLLNCYLDHSLDKLDMRIERLRFNPENDFAILHKLKSPEVQSLCHGRVTSLKHKAAVKIAQQIQLAEPRDYNGAVRDIVPEMPQIGEQLRTIPDWHFQELLEVLNMPNIFQFLKDDKNWISSF